MWQSKYGLQHWAEDIRSCNQRPKGTTVGKWCKEHGLCKATYYGRLRAGREACIEVIDREIIEKDAEASEDQHGFVELQPFIHPQESGITAVIRLGNASIEISENISDEFLKRIMETASHA